jgi:diadenosine tetraphosphate (Ap4A) HIT family hydrolase
VDAQSYDIALEKFSLRDNLLTETERWRVALRPKQVTLGALVLLPVRPIPDFDEVDAQEAAGLFGLVGVCQRVLRDAFHPDRFNLIAAMMKDNFVHFHLVPRYAEVRDFEGVSWRDADWPALVSFAGDRPVVPGREAVLLRLQKDFAGAAFQK